MRARRRTSAKRSRRIAGDGRSARQSSRGNVSHPANVQTIRRSGFSSWQIRYPWHDRDEEGKTRELSQFETYSFHDF